MADQRPGEFNVEAYSSHYTDSFKDENLKDLMDIWEDYKDKLILFLGAGASVGANNANINNIEKLPTALHLRNELWSKFMNKNGDFDLGMMSLEHATAIIESKVATKTLRQYVAKKFDTKKGLWQQYVLPFLNPKILFTTNYDNLIENGWKANKIVETELQLLFERKKNILGNRIPLYKPHGSVECYNEELGKGGLVLTQFDYFFYNSKKKELLDEFLEECHGCCVIFIGYSFLDFDLGSAIYKHRQKNKDMHWFAVFPREEPNVKNMYFTQLGVKTIAKTFHRFLVELDEQLNFIPEGSKFKDIYLLQEDGKIQ